MSIFYEESRKNILLCFIQQKTRRPKIKNRRQSEDKIINAIEDKVLREIRNLFEQEGYFKLVTVGNFHNNNYVEYESNDGRNKTLSKDEYFNKIRP